MATVSALGTNYNLPSYHGRVHQLTPSDTPLTTALMAGGLEIEHARTFEWQTFDLRNAAQNTVVDGDSAGTPELRSRGNVFNVLQTHREDVAVAYERQAQYGQFNGQNIAGDNPISDELSWQLTQRWKEVKRDIEYSLINGTYVLPGTNGTAAQTRGLIAAISTNSVDTAADNGQSATGETIDDLVDLTGHGYSDGQDVFFSSKTGGSNLAVDTRYYVVNATANTFQLAASAGGAALDFGSDITASTIHAYADASANVIGDAMQSAWDNGGLQESEMGVLLVNSTQKRWLSSIYGGDEPRDRNVGGVDITTIHTDFGELGVMLNRYVPQDTILITSLDQCKLHVREVPGKGVMFAEPLGKDGASFKYQLYTSVGLEYGNEASHAKLTNLTTTAP